MRMSRVLLFRALLLSIAAFSLYLVTLPFLVFTEEPDAPHLGRPAVAEHAEGQWRSIFELDSLLSELDEEMHNSAEKLRSIQHQMSHLSTNYALYGAWAPLSPAEYVFPLHPAALLLYILPYPSLLTCNDVEQLSDTGPADVSHPVAQTRKLSSLTKDYISQSIPVGHPFALMCQSQNGYVDSGGEECYRPLNHKLMVEGIFRQELDHYMIANVCLCEREGECMRMCTLYVHTYCFVLQFCIIA